MFCDVPCLALAIKNTTKISYCNAFLGLCGYQCQSIALVQTGISQQLLDGCIEVGSDV